VLLSSILASLLDPQAPAGKCQSEGAAAMAVRRVAEGIVAADNGRDIERVRSSYAPDAILLPPSEAPVRGWDAIRPRYDALFSAFSPAIEGHIDEVCVSGAIAYVRGRNGGRLAARGQALGRALDDAYLMLLRRGDGGRWEITHLMWHAASPPASRD
jgi:ketosteroid isomerase-like protein